MAPVLSTALIVIVVAGLTVYGPVARRREVARPAHLTPVPPAHQGSDPLSRLVGVLRRKRWARMVLTTASFGLLVGAVAMIGHPFYTNLYQSRYQDRLDNQMTSPELRQAYMERRVGDGDALTRIIIPAIEVDVVVVEGTTASALRAGAGHYPETPLPCEVGNVAIAGHRTTYGRPFHNVDLLSPGDEITLVTPIGQCTYEVSEDPFEVGPDAIEVVANTPERASLTLTTCHPKGSAAKRLIIKADMVRSEQA